MKTLNEFKIVGRSSHPPLHDYKVQLRWFEKPEVWMALTVVVWMGIAVVLI